MHTVARIGLIILSLLAHAACLIQPIQPPDAPAVVAPASDQDMASHHIVLRGESLRRIAAQYGTTSQALIDANQLVPRSLLLRGQDLAVPRIPLVGEAVATEALPAEAVVIHTVHRGESPYTIAKYYEIGVEELAVANRLQGPMLFKAQKLIIPTGGAEAVPQLVAGTPSEPAGDSSVDTPMQAEPQQLPALDTEPVTVTATITGEVPLASTDHVTVTEAVSDTVPTTLTEKVPTELTALDAWAEPDGGVVIFSPTEDGAYHSPIEIIGLANTQGGIVNLRLLDDNGQVLAWRVGIDKPQEGFDFFHTSLRFSVEEPTEAEVRISETNVADGTRLQQVEVPVVLLPGQRAIDIRLPSAGSVVCGEIPVSGYSDTSQARVVLELRTPDGEVVGMADTIGGHHGAYRDFFALLEPEGGKTQALLVSASASEPGGENGRLDETVVPITFYPAGTEGCP